jgi:hypothetical protein
VKNRLAMRFMNRLRRPAPRPVVAALGLAVLAAPAWLMADWLAYYALLGDDFWYISEARDPARLARYLFVPHNTHVVPLFRLWTYVLIELAGRMAAWPVVFSIGAYVPLVLAMLSVGHLVARERNSTALGLAAMVLVGVTTTTEPAVAWYSAGQALWSGVFVVLALLAARAWREDGSRRSLIAAFAVTLAAPLWWSAGLVAGPVVAGFLTLDPQPRNRKLAPWFLVPTVLTAGLIVLGSLRQLAGTAIVHEHHRGLWPRPIQAAFHTAQAIPEVLVAGNFGCDTETTPEQGLVLTAALALAWAWSWWGRGGPTPLGAAGAGIVVLAYLQVFYFRGNLPFASHLRTLRWYHAVPQLGAVLFLIGWGPRTTIKTAGGARPTYLGLLGVLGLMGAMLLLHTPRHQRRIIEAAPRVTEFESDTLVFRTHELRYLRARYFAEQHARRQQRALARLDQALPRVAHDGLGRDALKAAYGVALVPGMPKGAGPYNAIDLLRLPEHGRPFDAADVRRAFQPFLTPEPDPRPEWLRPYPQAPWPPPDNRSPWIDTD